MGKRAIVVGAGVIGLTSAIRLLENGYQVKIIAEKIWPNTLSSGPAALWEPFLSEPADKVYKWAKWAFQDFTELKKLDPTAGITVVSGYEYQIEGVREPFQKPKWLEFLEHRDLEDWELPEGHYSGVYFISYVIEAPHFIPWLMKRFETLGGFIQIGKVTNLNDLLSDDFKPQVIVNCTGLGSKEFGDDQVFPIRGQVVKVHAPFVKQFMSTTTANGDFVYVIPRSDCVTVGGTAQKNNWNSKSDPETTKKILEICDHYIPGIAKSKIISGLRPGRTSIRLESETITDSKGRKGLLVSNYGHGGSGVTLSWGCAKEVIELVHKSEQTAKL